MTTPSLSPTYLPLRPIITVMAAECEALRQLYAMRAALGPASALRAQSIVDAFYDARLTVEPSAGFVAELHAQTEAVTAPPKDRARVQELAELAAFGYARSLLVQSPHRDDAHRATDAERDATAHLVASGRLGTWVPSFATLDGEPV